MDDFHVQYSSKLLSGLPVTIEMNGKYYLYNAINYRLAKFKFTLLMEHIQKYYMLSVFM